MQKDRAPAFGVSDAAERVADAHLRTLAVMAQNTCKVWAPSSGGTLLDLSWGRKGTRKQLEVCKVKLVHTHCNPSGGSSSEKKKSGHAVKEPSWVLGVSGTTGSAMPGNWGELLSVQVARHGIEVSQRRFYFAALIDLENPGAFLFWRLPALPAGGAVEDVRNDVELACLVRAPMPRSAL
jgi:hypothetical protein